MVDLTIDKKSEAEGQETRAWKKGTRDSGSGSGSDFHISVSVYGTLERKTVIRMLFTVTASFFSFSGFDRKIAEGCGIEYGILQKQKNTKVDSFGGGLENGIKKVQKHERKPVGAFSFRRLMLHSLIP